MKKSQTNRIALFLVCALCLASVPISTPLRAQSAAPAGSAYRIQPNDVLTVFVYSHPELSVDVLTVAPDGFISTPLVQSVLAAGTTSEQLKAAIEKKLSDVIDVPNVTVIIKSIQSYRVFVTGKVQKPGILIYEKPITVLQALAMAGGFQDYAKKAEITIIRTNGKKIPFNWEDVTGSKGDVAKQNIFLDSGDTIIVP